MTQPQPTIRPDATIIPDKASVWVALESDVTDITSMIPTDPTANFATTGWQFCGLIDDKKGIPLDPAIEVRPYDAFGHPQFRVKLRKGTLKSGFTALETNDVTRTFVLPGSTDKKIGIPKNVQAYVLYQFVDEDIARVWCALRPAPLEVKSHGGIIDGELSYAEIVVHHVADAYGDVFQLVEETTGTTAPAAAKAYTPAAASSTE
jgi:hypothetical protein